MAKDSLPMYTIVLVIQLMLKESLIFLENRSKITNKEYTNALGLIPKLLSLIYIYLDSK